MLVKGDKIKLVKPIGELFTNVGEIYEVIDVDKYGIISFKLNDVYVSYMYIDTFYKYFEKYEEQTTVTQEQVDNIISESEIKAFTAFDKCTIVMAKLPNGFVLVEHSACVDPKNYDAEMGYNICLKRISDKIWELEGYKLQCELANKK